MKGAPLAKPGEKDKAVDGKEKDVSHVIEARNMLFDLESDPQQQNDVLEGNVDVHRAMRRRLVKLMEEVGTRPDLIDPWR